MLVSKHNIQYWAYRRLANCQSVGDGAGERDPHYAPEPDDFQSLIGGVRIVRRYVDSALLPRRPGRKVFHPLKQGIPQVCGECGRPYFAWPSYIKRRTGVGWCSKRCAGISRRQALVTVICQHCQLPQVVHAFEVKRRRFCSPDCRMAYSVSLPRFESLIRRTESCWLWQGPVNIKTGYGSFRGASNAHRAAWLFFRGPIPDGLCVNPDHLFLGTPADNVHDSQQKGRRPVKTAVAA